MNMVKTADDIWPKILKSLREKLPDQTVANWFESASTEIRDSDTPTLLLTVPSSYHRDHVRDRHFLVLKSACQKVLHEDVTIQFRVDEQSSSDNESAPQESSPRTTSKPSSTKEERPTSNVKTRAAPRKKRTEKSTRSSGAAMRRGPFSDAAKGGSSGNPVARPREFHRSRMQQELKVRYTFENFVEGDSNDLAKSASMAVASNPGETDFNPLLIYGGVGLGKTHLAQAIANHSVSQETAEFVCYASSEEFTSAFVQAIREGDGSQFSKKYRGVDLLILDDIQFFEGKEKTQEEFFHLFNALYQQNKQIVLCADRPPKEIEGVQKRLLSRFEWGLSADVQQPTFETRLAILQRKATVLDLDIEEEVLNLMAESITTNIRQLEGALKQLSARANLMDVKVDVATARNLLKDQIGLPKSRPVTPDDIFEVVTSFYDVSHEDLVGRSRRDEVVYPRHIAMYLCRKLTSLSLSATGLRFGGRDHSTVSHACEKVNDRLDVTPELEREVEKLERQIQRHAT